MKLIHIELREANDFVGELHRHNKPVTGHRFSIGAEHGGKLVGVCIVGRPVARKTDQKNTVEVTRLCTDGTKNACSFLYGAAARAAKALGYKAIQTFVLESEPGSSLRAAGWSKIGESGGGSWGRKSRPRGDNTPTEPKVKYGKQLR
jgi:hypothetical protein